MNIFKKITLLSAILAVVGLSVASFATPVAAIDVLNKSCSAASGQTAGGGTAPATGGGANAVCQSQDDDAMVTIKKVINLLLFVIGIVAVISIIIGGIMYTTSNGDQGKVKQAKDTIMYSVVGLVVAILAFAIVTFVVSSVG